MKSQTFLTLLVSSLVTLDCLIGADDFILPFKRQKRYLAFPNKAVFVLTISLLKGIANDIRVGPTTKVVTIHELDVLFPLPHDPSPFELAQIALGQPPIFHQSHSRYRRSLYRQLEDLFYLQGLSGRSCIMKALCEAKQLPETTEENLLQDLLLIIFLQPHNVSRGVEEEYQINEKDCKHYKELCHFSIIDFAFDLVDKFSILHSA